MRKISLNFVQLFCILFLLHSSVNAQLQDNTTYPWPISPKTLQRAITGTFGEYRSTSENGHFHNGTDIPAAANTPVYAVIGGTVAVAYHDGSTGYDSYVRITSTIDGQKKNMTYYHTIPTVSVGQYVQAGQQISKIAIDHVHLIEYMFGNTISGRQMNSLRPDGGLTPYTDNWKPHIRYVKFLVDETSDELPASLVGGKVDIVAHIQEVNGTYSSAENNGTYEVGYKILTEDRDSVVFEPRDEGWRYRYYIIPSNSYVNVAYFRSESSTSKHVYKVTNGRGANEVERTRVVLNDYWDADELPQGNYTVMVFTRDSRGNTDTMYVPVTTGDVDLFPPEPPVFSAIEENEDFYFTLFWNPPDDDDVKGYQLYYSLNESSFRMRDDETVLTQDLNSRKYQGFNPMTLYFKLYAVDNSVLSNRSIESDTYGIRIKDDGKKILIVDAFDRHSNTSAWKKAYHDFVIRYARAFDMSFVSCHHSALASGDVALDEYEVVFWMAGDESAEDEAVSQQEQTILTDYLKQGGNLYISGENIAFALEGSGDSYPEDAAFLNNVLHATYLEDEANDHYAKGEEGTLFQDLDITIGSPYEGAPYLVTSPDVIDTINGSKVAFRYLNGKVAGVSYSGYIDGSPTISNVLYTVFPFESLGLLKQREALMEKVFEFFDTHPNSIESDETVIPASYSLAQNFPNPFNPGTRITFTLPESAHTKLAIYDILGREVAVLVNEKLSAGVHTIDFSANDITGMFASGIYLLRLSANDFSDVKKMNYIK